MTMARLAGDQKPLIRTIVVATLLLALCIQDAGGVLDRNNALIGYSEASSIGNMDR